MNITTKLLLTATIFGALTAAQAKSKDLAYLSKAPHWEYSLSHYIWLAGVKEEVTTIPGLPSAPIDISPKEFIDGSHISAMVVLLSVA